ncbi:MAG: signal peptidase II [Deltaproteobacteria bacterium]|nr:signal peptidase II [Deltaproteobacteria bacterium]
MVDFLLFVGILTADRVSKIMVVNLMDLYQSTPVIPSFFHLTYVRNTGGAFSILAGWDSPFRRVFFILVPLCALLLLLYLYREAQRSSSTQVRLAITAIAAGAVGNLYDRTVTGKVVDFLDVFVGPYHWPAFNVADSAITVGAIYLGFLFLRGHMDSMNS